MSDSQTHQHQTNNQNHSWIWKTPCHPREKCFLWQSFVKGLPTNIRLQNASCVNNKFCPLCQLHPKTHLHRPRNCKNSKQVWLSLQPLQSQTSLTKTIKYGFFQITATTLQAILIFLGKPSCSTQSENYGFP